MKTPPTLSLDLSDCELEEPEFINILNSLAANTTLQMINLNSNVITAKVAYHLVRVLRNCNHIESLSLLNCKLNGDMIVDILMSLTDKTSLKCIELNFKYSTKIGNPSADPADLLTSVLVNNKSIEKMVLPNCNNAAMIAPLIKLSSSLQHLDIHSSKVHIDTLTTIINNNVALRYLDISNCGIRYESLNEVFNSMLSLRFLEYLNLRRNTIINADILAHVIEANVKLKHLNISHCEINDTSLVAVFKALQNKKCLSHFDFSYSFVVKTAAVELAKIYCNSKNITHLVLSHCVFHLQSFCEIVSPLKQIRCLRHLDLSSTAVNNQSLVDDISDIIDSNTMLQHLNLSYCRIFGPHFLKIAGSLTRLSMLKHLDISCNEVNDEGAVAIASAITSNVSLQYLLMSDCSMQESGIKKIANALTRISSLLSLDVSLNQITENVELEIANAICSNSSINTLRFSNCFLKDGCFHIIKAIQSITTLKTLDLESIIIPNDQAECLSKGFSFNTTLQSLNLSNNNLGEAKLSAILASLQNISVLQHFSLNSTKINTQMAEAIATVLCNSCKFVNYISLHKCKLSALHIRVIAKALKKVSSLKYLDMSFNTIYKISAEEIASIISHNMLEYLNLSDCNLQDHAIVVIAGALSNISSLLYLNLSNNFITQQVATRIGDVIYSNNVMRELHLRNCLGPNTGSIIISAAKQKPSLKCLDLSSNIITPSTERIIASVVDHSQLEYIDLSYCDLSETGFLLILDGFIKISILQHVNIASNTVTDSVGQKLASVVSKSVKLQHLNISKCSLSTLHIGQIVKVHSLLSLQHLDISHNNVTNDAAIHIATLLGDLKYTLEYFNISNCNLLAFGLKRIIEALTQISYLCFLDISNNNINNHVAKKLATALRYHTFIQHLNISNCFSGENSISIFEAIKTKKTMKYFDTARNPINDKISTIMTAVINNNTKLEFLNLSQCELSETGFISVLNALSHNFTLKHLNVASNRITEDVAKLLINVAFSNRNLSYLNISNTELKSVQLFRTLSSIDINLQYLDLSHTVLQSQESVEIAKLLTRSVMIEHLDFSWTLLQEKGVHAILSVLVNTTFLQHLNLQSCTINNQISELLATVIANNTHLSYLNLSKTKLQQEGVIVIAKALKQSHSIQHLILNSNCIPNEAAKEISLAIKYHLPLKHLAMFDCKLGQTGLLYIVKSLQTISSLWHLDLRGMVISAKAAAIIASALSNNPGIQYLDFILAVFLNLVECRKSMKDFLFFIN